MVKKILAHRDKMRFPKERSAIELKTIEELQELQSEIYIPTSNSNFFKEVGDVMITIYALCETKGMTVEECVDYAIRINESRK